MTAFLDDEKFIEVFKRAWTDDVVAFDGEFYTFADVSMDPKPVQRPRPPIIYGGISPLGAAAVGAAEVRRDEAGMTMQPATELDIRR